jgi:hypothetical protein
VRPLAALDAPIDAVPEFHACRGSQQRLHDRGLGSAIADHDQRRGLQERRQGLHQRRIERLRFADQIAVGVLFRLSVEPDHLRAREQAEFVEVLRTSIHFGDVADVGLLVIERLRQAYVEIGSEDRSRQSAQNQLGGRAIARADVLAQGGQVEKRSLAVRVRLEEMLDDQGEVFGKTVVAVDEPLLRMKPRRPLGCLDLFGKRFAAELEIGIGLLREPLDAFGLKWNSRRKRGAGAEKKRRPRVIVGLQKRAKKGDTILGRHRPTLSRFRGTEQVQKRGEASG